MAYPAATCRVPACKKSSAGASSPGVEALSTEKIDPTDTFTSMFDEPSKGSNTSRYLPRAVPSGS